MASKLFIPQKIQPDSLQIHPDGSRILMEYKDVKGRTIKRYSKEEIFKNYQNKYKRTRLFEENVDKIVSSIKKDINSSDAKKAQSALILYIIYKTGLRIGSDNDTKADVKAYGISTLLNKHINFDPEKKYVYLDFIGKKGVRNKSLIKDPLIYEKLLSLKTPNWSKEIFQTSSKTVRNYFNDLKNNKGKFKIKDFRTLKANEIAKKLIDSKKGPAPTEKKFRKWQLLVADYVAKKLGNTRAVALNDYIDPQLWQKWRKPEWGVFIPKKIKLDEDKAEG